MSRIRGKNTKIEKKMKKILKDNNLKFVQHPKIFGNPDFLVGNGTAIFCDGDFWHGYDYENKKKPTKKFWKDADNQGGNFSVNLRSCIHSDECSIAIHPHNGEYYHVALIELAEFNASGRISCPLVAQYKPIEEDQNLCHFEFFPKDGTVLKWMELRVALDDPFPPGKMPTCKDEEDKASAAFVQYQSLLTIRRWIRSPDGQLDQ